MDLRPSNSNIYSNPRVAQTDVKITKKYKRALLMNKLIPIIVFLITVLICASLLFAFMSGVVNTTEGFIIPMSTEVAVGDYALVTESGDGPQHRAAQIFITQPALIGTVIAGPYGQLEKTHSGWKINGSGTFDYEGSDTAEPYLSSEYIIHLHTDEYIRVNMSQVRGSNPQPLSFGSVSRILFKGEAEEVVNG